jgi:hypothetical protein
MLSPFVVRDGTDTSFKGASTRVSAGPAFEVSMTLRSARESGLDVGSFELKSLLDLLRAKNAVEVSVLRLSSAPRNPAALQARDLARPSPVEIALARSRTENLV